jgi:hypothetical protein
VEVGVSDEAVSRYEFETFKSLARDLRDADRAQVARIAQDVDNLDTRLDSEMERLAEQREGDRSAAAETTRHHKEWSWQRVSALVMAGLALAALWVQSLALHK